MEPQPVKLTEFAASDHVTGTTAYRRSTPQPPPSSWWCTPTPLSTHASSRWCAPSPPCPRLQVRARRRRRGHGAAPSRCAPAPLHAPLTRAPCTRPEPCASLPAADRRPRFAPARAGMRPLHLACLLGYLPVAIALHELGADVRQHGQSGRLGGAMAGCHQLARLHLKAWGCPRHS